MYLLVMVLDNVRRLDEVLRAWVGAGVKGVTILESTGINRVLQRTDAQAAYMGFSRVFGGGPVGHNTLFAVIESMETAHAAITATEAVLGSLQNPDTGIMFVVPIAESWGLPGAHSGEQTGNTDNTAANG